MATPYMQVRMDSPASTQDEARARLRDVPVVVIAERQEAGRGRTGSEWWNAPRGLAVSVAFRRESADFRPFSLMAGVAAARAIPGVGLKWPNDIMVSDMKAGGILVELQDDVVVAGMGLNLWWPDAPEGAAALYDEDPGPERHAEIGALWAAEFLRIVGEPGWPRDEYRKHCVTLGWVITWEPEGEGRALDVAPDGGLVVETGLGVEVLHAGRVRHIR
ncbi:MAG: biotin--[acetyl-CoA-carboxylase] ligase [Actinomycetes bacterium]|jgi:BirA family biotin operon repressor/biotin-[acetyl-CoA-carboxylase] ligase